MTRCADHGAATLLPVARDDDDLSLVPWWDPAAFRMVETIERSIVRLRLGSQGEFIAIINAIEMQLESRNTVPSVVHLLIDSLRTLALARGLDQRQMTRLDQRLDQLAHRVATV